MIQLNPQPPIPAPPVPPVAPAPPIIPQVAPVPPVAPIPPPAPVADPPGPPRRSGRVCCPPGEWWKVQQSTPEPDSNSKDGVDSQLNAEDVESDEFAHKAQSGL